MSRKPLPGLMGRPLFAFRSNHYCLNLSYIHSGVEKLRPGELPKVHKLVTDLFDLAGNFLARFHPQLDRLPDILLQNPKNGIAGLEIDLSLPKNIGAGKCEKERDENGESFHISLLCRRIGVDASE